MMRARSSSLVLAACAFGAALAVVLVIVGTVGKEDDGAAGPLEQRRFWLPTADGKGYYVEGGAHMQVPHAVRARAQALSGVAWHARANGQPSAGSSGWAVVHDAQGKRGLVRSGVVAAAAHRSMVDVGKPPPATSSSRREEAERRGYAQWLSSLGGPAARAQQMPQTSQRARRPPLPAGHATGMPRDCDGGRACPDAIGRARRRLSRMQKQLSAEQSTLTKALYGRRAYAVPQARRRPRHVKAREVSAAVRKIRQLVHAYDKERTSQGEALLRDVSELSHSSGKAAPAPPAQSSSKGTATGAVQNSTSSSNSSSSNSSSSSSSSVQDAKKPAHPGAHGRAFANHLRRVERGREPFAVRVFEDPSKRSARTSRKEVVQVSKLVRSTARALQRQQEVLRRLAMQRRGQKGAARRGDLFEQRGSRGARTSREDVASVSKVMHTASDALHRQQKALRKIALQRRGRQAAARWGGTHKLIRRFQERYV